MIIGITGGIASGKSTVSDILKINNFEIIDADSIGKKAYEKGKAAYYEIIDSFGKEVLSDDGEINRKILGEIVFSDPKKLQKLNKITHKYIISEVRYLVDEYKSNKKSAVVDAALLYETGLDRLVDEVWYVEINQQTQIERLMKRNGFSKEEAQKRIDAQKIYKNKEKADRIIYNNGNEKELRKQVLEYINFSG